MVEAQIASDFHKDKRQEELIDEITKFTECLGAATEAIRGLKASIDTMNTDTGSLYNRLYGRLNMLTGVIAGATVIQVGMQIAIQIFHLRVF